MLIQCAAYLWEIVSSIKGNCFKTSDLLMEINFGRSPKFFLSGTFGNYLISDMLLYSVLTELFPMVPIVILRCKYLAIRYPILYGLSDRYASVERRCECEL